MPGFPFWIAVRTSLRIELARKLNTCRPEFSEHHSKHHKILMKFKETGNMRNNNMTICIILDKKPI